MNKMLTESEKAARKLAYAFPKLFASAATPAKGKNSSYIAMVPKDPSAADVVDKLLGKKILEESSLLGVAFSNDPTYSTYEYETGNWTYDCCDNKVPEVRSRTELSGYERRIKLVEPLNGRKPDIYAEGGKIYINPLAVNQEVLDNEFYWALRNNDVPVSKLALPKDAKKIEKLEQQAQDVKKDVSSISALANDKDGKLSKKVNDFLAACNEVCSQTGIEQIVKPEQFRKLVADTASLKL